MASRKLAGQFRLRPPVGISERVRAQPACAIGALAGSQSRWPLPLRLVDQRRWMRCVMRVS
jgi:hypothetical protein